MINCDGCGVEFVVGDVYVYYTRMPYTLIIIGSEANESHADFYRYCMSCEEKHVRLPTRASLNSRR